MEITHVTCKALTFKAAQLDIKGKHYAPRSKGFDGRRNVGPESQSQVRKKKKKFRREKLTEARWGGRALPGPERAIRPNP